VVNGPAVIAGYGAAFPGTETQADLWQGYFQEHFGGSRLAKRIFESSGVRTRHGVANPLVEDVSSWTTEQRMIRYVTEALPLGKDAVALALGDAGLDPADVGLFAVASCTGYTTPGLDIRLARDLGMASTVQRLFVGHMGCYAAIPALGAVGDFVVARGRPAVLLCLELTSLHVQPPTTDPDQLVAHALFSDAAAAVVVLPSAVPVSVPVPVPGRGPVPVPISVPVPVPVPVPVSGRGLAGLELVDVAALTDPATADHMTWDVTDLGFRMGLSPRVPDVLAEHVGPMVTGLLAAHGLTVPDVSGWAVHPGGPRILDVVGAQLRLPAGSLDASHAVLADHGNCSSATVLMVADELTRRAPAAPGGHVVALAFGPGLTLYAALLRSVGEVR
jgi:predicted naringenin-chalcone synthase